MNNQQYSYEQILSEVKELLLPTIYNTFPEDFAMLGLRKEDLGEIIYTHIMLIPL